MKQKMESSAAKLNAGAGENAAMREAPRPFNLHLFTTACMLSSAGFPYVCDPAQRGKALEAIKAMTAEMMEGLNVYRTANMRADRRMHPAIWQDGGTRLLRTNPSAKADAAQILLVPSLINRADILDLDAQHSFAAFLAAKGFDPYILDWGPPGTPEKTFRIDDYITQRFYPALNQLNRPHVLGYCMGGTMAAGGIAALAGHKEKLRSLTLLAAPWDFHAGDAGMALRMNAFTTCAQGVMDAQGVLPVDWIQALFASIDPLFAFNKFRNLVGMDPNSPELRQFVIVEDWLNDGVDLTAPAAKQALEDWYIANQPHNGVWTIGKSLADVSQINVPVLVVAAGNDRLVPSASALAIVQQIDAADTLTPDLGHIGLMASPRAIAGVWEKLADWLTAR